MKFRTHSFKHAATILETEEFRDDYHELLSSIEGITEEDIIEKFKSSYQNSKSISAAINVLLKDRLTRAGWLAEPPIFQESGYSGKREKKWRLDFAKGGISVETAFNHGEATAWNLLKPVLASELNHVKKAIQTQIGVIICATADLKLAGGFDSAVGEYEKFLTYLKPLQNVLSVPILFIGLEKPERFEIVHRKEGARSIGEVRTLYESK